MSAWTNPDLTPDEWENLRLSEAGDGDDDPPVPYVALDIDPNATWDDIVEMLNMLNLKPAKKGAAK